MTPRTVELVARVRSVLRRTAEHGGAEPLALGGGWVFDRESRCLVGGRGRRAPLTAAESTIMAALGEAPGRPISREALAARTGRKPGNPGNRSIDVLVSRIRRKVTAQCGGEPIRSIRNVGYMLDTDAPPRGR